MSYKILISQWRGKNKSSENILINPSSSIYLLNFASSCCSLFDLILMRFTLVPRHYTCFLYFLLCLFSVTQGEMLVFTSFVYQH